MISAEKVAGYRKQLVSKAESVEADMQAASVRANETEATATQAIRHLGASPVVGEYSADVEAVIVRVILANQSSYTEGYIAGYYEAIEFALSVLTSLELRK